MTKILRKQSEKINVTLKKGLENDYIEKSEYIAMNADVKKAGRFFCNFKVHKEHEHLPHRKCWNFCLTSY